MKVTPVELKGDPSYVKNCYVDFDNFDNMPFHSVLKKQWLHMRLI